MDSDRSLSSGFSMPQWMKTKMIDTRLDIDQAAFSPPAHDDNFLYIRYPRKKSITEERRKSGHRIAAADLPDVSKHTAPCRQFIEGSPPLPANKKQVKSNGTDDGFKGEAAACGSSIVKVAQQIVSEKRFNQHELKKETIDFPVGYTPSTIRRGSRSLPVSPSTSPKVNRKLLGHNKYFTGAFVDGDKPPSGWILSGFLGKREQLANSVLAVSEENITGSLADLAVPEEEIIKQKPMTQVFKAKPSELREMNFWSPTSM